MTINQERLAKGKATLIRRAYAIRNEGNPKQEDTVTGGWITLNGKKRFALISVRKAKQRHCRSCAFYRHYNPCRRGFFSSPTTKAGDCFRDRNWRKRG